jgi:hypothetical protein
MSNPELDNYCDIPLTEKQINFLIDKLERFYGPNESLPIGEIKAFMEKIYLGRKMRYEK